jgi:hypothetical protein
MTINIDVWKYGNQQELQSTRFDERSVYGEPQHEVAAPVNVELRESISYLRSWQQHVLKRRQSIETKQLISTLYK